MLKKLLVLALPALLYAGPAVADSKTRDIMQNAADALEVLLPLSLDSDTFLSPGNRDTVMKNLSKLENSAEALAEHGATESLDFQLLAAAFARAAGRVRGDFEFLHPAESRYFLVDLTQHCVACHSRDTADRDFPLSSALDEYLQEQPLNEMERFWEAAIRTAPGRPHATEAYALLEEYAATTFSGELPFERTDETFARLAELRSMIGIE